MSVIQQTLAASILCFLTQLSAVVGQLMDTKQNPAIIEIPESSNSAVDLHVRLYVCVKDSASEVEAMKAALGSLFSNTGVHLLWLDCRTGNQRTGQHECNRPLGRNELVIRIVPSCARHSAAVSPSTLGYSAPGGTMGTIYFGAAVRFAGAGDARIGEILAYAVAHELTHLITGTGRHSSRGIMAAQWTKETAAIMRLQGLWFSPEEARSLKNALRTSEALVQSIPR